MESPPSNSTWSEAFILSDDSGLLLTNSSISSGSISDSRSGRIHHRLYLEDSDCEDKSLSQDDSLDGMSDIMCGENFNTLKKTPNWTEYQQIRPHTPIEPPPEFQDRPIAHIINYSEKFALKIVQSAIFEYKDNELRRLKLLSHLNRPLHVLLGRHQDWNLFSPCHRPSSRSSLGSSRLSSSHNSLSMPQSHKVDDSSFITQAVSHDTLSSNQISDLYNVPFDSDVYAVPIDVVKPPLKPKKNQIQYKKKRRNTSSGFRDLESKHKTVSHSRKNIKCEKYQYCVQTDTKRHSVAGTSAPIIDGEPIHMTLQEVRQYLQTLYSSSSDSSDHKEKKANKQKLLVTNNNINSSNYNNNNNNNNSNNKNNNLTTSDNNVVVAANKELNGRTKKSAFLLNIKNKKVKDSCDIGKQINMSPTNKDNNNINNNNNNNNKRKRAPQKLFNFRQTLCNMFRFRRFLSPEHTKTNSNNRDDKLTYDSNCSLNDNISSRALPPLPFKEEDETIETEQILDFATSIQRVKDYGWYWGPLSSEGAEKILSNEPDGSFIVRDSSDDHYIFSLTFKLNNCVRHVRIDHDQGNFSFGGCTKFKSQTIVEFIENAVEHSRSGRYLFFLHRRPNVGPVRVQLLHPVSRFKQVQSLQHICRFVIHKVVRRDLIQSLPLPRRMIDYLNTPHYYSEHLIDIEDNNNQSSDESVPPNSEQQQQQQQQQNVQQQEQLNPNVPVNNYVILNNSTRSNTRQS